MSKQVKKLLSGGIGKPATTAAKHPTTTPTATHTTAPKTTTTATKSVPTKTTTTNTTKVASKTPAGAPKKPLSAKEQEEEDVKNMFIYSNPNFADSPPKDSKNPFQSAGQNEDDVSSQSSTILGEGTLFRAIGDYAGEEEGDLSFKAGNIIRVFDQGDGPKSWWFGELDGVQGSFPGTFVTPIAPRVKTFTAPEDSDPNEPATTNAPKVNLGASPRNSALKQASSGPKGSNVKFHESVVVHEIESPLEYDRKGEFNPAVSSVEWSREEQEEKIRMLEDRWSYMERSLNGSKCEERIAHEKAVAEEEARKKAEEEKKKADRAEKKKAFMLARAARKADQDKDGDVGGETASAPPPPTGPITRADRLKMLAEARKNQPLPSKPQQAHSATTKSSPPRAPSEAEQRAERLKKLQEERQKSKTEGAGNNSLLAPDHVAASAGLSHGNTIAPPRPKSKKPSLVSDSQGDGLPTPNGVLFDVPVPAPPPVDVAAVEKAVEALAAKIEQLKKTNPANGLNGFNEEFKALDLEDKKAFNTSLCGAAVAHPDLNRYHDILPYDKARVVLNNSSSPKDDYINASLVRAPCLGSPDFIAAQGPLPTSVEHFWKMVAQQKVRLIVMLTKVKEANRVKCQQYWPELKASASYATDGHGPRVKVTALAETPTEAWVERTFVVEQAEADGSTSRLNVTQLHFVDWPDHGVPDSPASFLSFMTSSIAAYKEALNAARYSNEPCPMIVHCSAGVGRSGVFCVIYALLNSLAHYGRADTLPPTGGVEGLDVLAMVRALRVARRYMVQTVDQYMFCYTALLESARHFLAGLKSFYAPSKEIKVSSTDPVWLYDSLSDEQAARLVEDNRSEGKFVVSLLGVDKYKLTVVIENHAQHYTIARLEPQGHLHINGKAVGKCDTIEALIDYMRRGRTVKDFALLLSEYVPRPDADPSLVDDEQFKAAQIIAYNASVPPFIGVQEEEAQDEEEAVHQGEANLLAEWSEKRLGTDLQTLTKRLSQRGLNESLLLRQSSVILAHPQLSYANPPPALVNATPLQNGDELMVKGRSGHLSCLNTVYLELDFAVYNRPTFRSKEPVRSDDPFFAGDLFICYDAGARAWVVYTTALGVIASASGDCSNPGDVVTFWSVLDTRGKELVEDPDVLISRLSKKTASAPKPPSSKENALWDRLRASHARERVLSELLSTSTSDTVSNSANPFDARSTASNPFAPQQEGDASYLSDQTPLASRDGGSPLWKAREKELLAEITRLKQLLINRVVSELAATDETGAPLDNNPSSDAQSATIAKLREENASLRHQMALLEQEKADLLEENAELKDHFHSLGEGNLGSLGDTNDDEETEESAPESLNPFASAIRANNGSSNSNNSNNANNNFGSNDALEELRRSALASADEFNRVTTAPKRGLPIGAMMDSEDEEQQEEEDASGDGIKTETYVLDDTPQKPKRGLPQGLLWNDLDDDGSADGSFPSHEEEEV